MLEKIYIAFYGNNDHTLNKSSKYAVLRLQKTRGTAVLSYCGGKVKAKHD